MMVRVGAEKVLVHKNPVPLDAEPLVPNCVDGHEHCAYKAFEYDVNGNQTASEDPLHRRTEFRFDLMNRCTQTVVPQVSGETVRRSRSTVYDPLGRTMQEVNESGVITAFGYDALGRLRSVTNDFRFVYAPEEVPIRTAYEYDELGNLTEQTDARDNVTQFEYDALGRRIYRILPGASSGNEMQSGKPNPYLEKTKYLQVSVPGSEKLTLQKQVRDFRGRTLTFDYDLADRLSRVTPAPADILGNAIPEAERVTAEFYYRTDGQRQKVVQSGGTARTVQYVYDETSFVSLAQAHALSFGELKIFKDAPPTGRWDPKWDTAVSPGNIWKDPFLNI